LQPMGSIKPSITLIPWDPESPSHVERLYQQRIACRWDSNYVESWRGLQRQGKKTIQFIVLPLSDPATDSQLAKHIEAFPLENLPIQDTAVLFGGKSRDPSGAMFTPVGHISLDPQTDNPGEYEVASFYVSRALQGSGLGRATMDTVEGMAASEPLNAKTLLILTGAKENYVMGEKWIALGRDPPTVSLYQRRGYHIYGRIEKRWDEADSTGKLWYTDAVKMRKDIR
ncbi:hypothetical protein B0O99DRAFT_523484, partial [Bisporella sp. PMI_857]